MVNGIRMIYPCRLSKGFSLKFYVGFRVWQELPEEGRRIHWPKCCEYNSKGEDSLNTLNDKKNKTTIDVVFNAAIWCYWEINITLMSRIFYRDLQKKDFNEIYLTV